jgi:hypothetical protein
LIAGYFWSGEDLCGEKIGMKKIFKGALLAGLVTVSVSASAPAAARSDGEKGYTLACVVLWLFGNDDVCGELR